MTRDSGATLPLLLDREELCKLQLPLHPTTSPAVTRQRELPCVWRVGVACALACDDPRRMCVRPSVAL